MNGIQRVMQRIANIENRFGSTAAPVNFAQLLDQQSQGDASMMGTTGTANTTNTALTASASNRPEVANLVSAAAAKYNVNPKLALAVATAESNLNPDAVSSVGARGVMQLMPETARSLGVRNIDDPRDNIDGGVHYLQQMLTTFGGDVPKAVAAYNAGPGAVQSYNGVPPYSETRAYVNRVLDLMR